MCTWTRQIHLFLFILDDYINDKHFQDYVFKTNPW